MDLKYKVGVILCIVLGFVLILSGVGKLFMGLPAQLDFMDNLSPVFGLTELEKNMLIYILPWVEILAGLLLVLQLFPSIVAVLVCVPLTLGFMVNNIWMLLNNVDYEHCNSCFGIFEQYTGSLTPEMALVLDGSLFLIAIVIVFITPRYKLLWGLLK